MKYIILIDSANSNEYMYLFPRMPMMFFIEA